MFLKIIDIKVNIRREYKYLGVIRASPCDYVQRYGNSLIPSTQLPQVVDEFKTPEGLVLAAQHRANELHELCGDVEALSLIDLEKEGLGGYRQYLQRIGAARSASRASFGQQQLKQQQAAKTTQAPDSSSNIEVYSTHEQIQSVYPNLEHILAQYTLTPQATNVPVKSPSVGSLRFQAPQAVNGSISTSAVDAQPSARPELFDRSVSATSIGKRSVTSVTSLNTNANNGTAYSTSLIETIFK